MINLAVINVKSLIKYLFTAIIVSIILWGVYSFFKDKQNFDYNSILSSLDLQDSNNLSISNTDTKSSTDEETLYNSSNFFTFLLDKTIPGIQVLNNQNTSSVETTYIESMNPLQFLLSSELPIMTSMVNNQDNNFHDNFDSTDSSNSDSTSISNGIEHAKTDVNTEVIKNSVPNKYTDSYNSVEIRNETNYSLTNDVLDCSNLAINKSDVIIFHTHTCESYTPSENFQYEQSGTFRTTNLDYSVARVGSSLSEQLLSYGYNVTHDKTYHDYPAYSGSYGRSMATIENVLVSKPNTDIIIDIHRDAIGDTSYAPSVKIGDEIVSQLMFVMGTDGGGLTHPNWQQNLKFAIKVQEKANELYPGLFRPILLRNSRYNQQLGKAACIIEVGATGNTLEQSMASMKYLSLVLNEVLKGI